MSSDISLNFKPYTAYENVSATYSTATTEEINFRLPRQNGKTNPMARRIIELEDENAKLRELVRAMWLYDYAGKFSSAQDDVEHVAMVYQSMRELGVEL